MDRLNLKRIADDSPIAEYVSAEFAQAFDAWQEGWFEVDGTLAWGGVVNKREKS